jgi:hypothetical protein
MSSPTEHGAMLELLRRLDERQDRMDVTLTENTASLKEHIRRTDLLQAQVDSADTRIKPLEKLAAKAMGAVWAAGAIVTAVLAAKQLGLF